MSSCEECRVNLDAYLDGELQGSARETFRSHTMECAPCKNELEERRRFLTQVRAARPEILAPALLRERVTRILEADTPVEASSLPLLTPDLQAIGITHRLRSWISKRRWRPALALGMPVLAVAAVTIVWMSSGRNAQAKNFVDAAMEAHQRQLAAGSPLQIKTSSPSEIVHWFATRTPFRFRLPNYQEGPGETPKYKLIGGRLIDVNDHPAAYIAYQMQNELISLVMTSSTNAVASGGETTKARGLTFHSHRENSLQVVTWSVHNLTYGLVSSVTVPARQSCLVCHARPEDRDLLRNLHDRAATRPFQHELTAMDFTTHGPNLIALKSITAK